MGSTGRGRFGAVAGLAALAVAVSGCGTTTVAGRATSAPTTSTTAQGVAADSAEVCARLAESGRALVQEMLAGSLGGDPDDLAELDPDAVVRDAVAAYGSRLRAEAVEASDPALRAATERAATAAEGLAASPGPPELEGSDLEKADAEMQGLCEEAADATRESGPEATSSIGAEGDPCELPVSFELAADWEPEAVDLDGVDEELADLFAQGPFVVACELDGKPAGHLGFIRVYTAGDVGGSPRRSLETFVDGEFPDTEGVSNYAMREVEYADAELGGRAASEVRYVTWNATLEQTKTYAAFAVDTPRGAVVVKLGGFDDAEHEAMLPAYELVKRTLRVNP